MMNINKKELKKISYDFRFFASRVINANYREIASLVAMFVAYIERTPILIEYIMSCPFTSSEEDLKKGIKAVSENYGREMLNTGATPEAEIAYIFRLLKLLSTDPSALLDIGYSYCNSNNFQDMTKAFGNHIVLPFTNNVNTYLTHLGIDMGIDEGEQYNITVNGGQVNLAKDNASIHAVQNNGISSDAMQCWIDTILATVKNTSTSEVQIQQLSETLLAIQEEMTRPEPKKSVIKLLLSGLQNSATVIGAVPLLAQKVDEFAIFLAPYLD